MLEVGEVDLGAGVRAGFTDRRGGVSLPPFDGLNLGDHVGDDPGAVAANRALVARWLGAPVVFADQVHGTAVVVLDDVPAGPVGAADALVSTDPRVGVGVLVADCVPVLLADADAGVVGAAHAGRGGLAAGVVQAVVQAMVDAGARREAIAAAIGPSIHGASYEVPAAMRDEVGARVPGTASTTSWGTPGLDLPAGVRAVLEAERVGRLVESGPAGDTWTDARYFSYRREGRTGRFAGVVRVAAGTGTSTGTSRTR